MVNMARRVHKEFRQLKEEADPQWSRNRRRGVLDARVASNPKSDPREVFREWEDGQDDIADLEVVILMDISSSMNSGMGQMYGIPAGRAERRCYVASKALWILRTALDKLDASTTVLGFNGYGVRIYDRDERTGRTAFKSVSVSGGTHPDEALRAAKNVLDSSKRAHKVLIILSDGQWYSSDGDDMTEQLSKDGVTTALFGIGYDPAGDLHGTNHAAEVMDLDGIVAAVKSTVKVAMRKKVRR
jgi:uncharacterized sporulation protein YeaH/YhbH (DUF444 family)